MAATTRVEADVSTVGELRAFLAECEQAGLADDTALLVKTRLSWNAYGPQLRAIKAEGCAQ